MEQFELIKSKILRGESEIEVANKIAEELRRIIRLVKLLDAAKAQFPKLAASTRLGTHTRLGRCKDFRDYCSGITEKSDSWQEICKLRPDALLFSSICFTVTQLEDVAFKASEIEVYVEAYPELKNTDIQKVIKHRLGPHLESGGDRCESLWKRILGSVVSPEALGLAVDRHMGVDTDATGTEGISRQGESYPSGDPRLC